MSDVSSVSSTPTAMTGAGGGDKIRILGTNTGLDVDGIVKKMLKPDQTRIDDEDKKIQKLQWKQEAYQDIISSVKDFQNSYFNLANLSSMVTRGDNYSVYKATSGDSTVVTVTALSNAIEGTYSLNVKTLAQKASISGNDLSTVKSDVTATTKLSDLGLTTSDKLTICVDNSTYYDVTFATSDQTISGYLSMINQETKGTVSGYYDEVSRKVILQRTDSGASKNIQIQQTNMSETFGLTNGTSTSVTGTYGLTGTALTGVSLSTPISDPGLNINTNDILYVKINGQEYQFKASSADETLQDFLKNDITNKSDGKIVASFDASTNSIKLVGAGTNTSQNIQIEYGKPNDMSAKLKLNNVVSSGLNSDFTITSPLGESNELTSYDSNNVSINGVSFTLQKVSNDSSTNTTVTVTPDIDTTFNLIKGFIDKYNALVEKIQTKLTEAPDKDSVGRFQTYEPLTAAQKAAMTTDQITKWEAKAKVGIVANDDTLTTMMDSMREAFFDKVGDVTAQFGRSIGLDSIDDYKQGGKIQFTDGGEDKLKAALAGNKSQIVQLFTKTSTSTDKNEKYKDEGVFQRINDILQDYVGRVGTSLNDGKLTSLANKQDDHSIAGTGTGDTIPDQIYRESISLKDLNTRMSDDSEKYYNEFSKLETAMESLNSQSSWISQMTQG